MQGVPLLPEVVVEVMDFEVEVEEEVDGLNRTNKIEQLATVRVHLVVSDRSVRKIGYYGLSWCTNLVKVMAPFLKR